MPALPRHLHDSSGHVSHFRQSPTFPTSPLNFRFAKTDYLGFPTAWAHHIYALDLTMQRNDFHHFCLLPKELRDTIWGFAIRPDRPSAHFFSLCYDGPESMRTTVTAHWASDFKDWRLQLSSPQFSQTSFGGYSWTDGNPSAYVLDAGLWTACHESREAMKRYYRLPPCSVDADNATDSTLSTGFRPFACSEGLVLDRYITLFPDQDLLCLQPEPSYAPVPKKTIGWLSKQNFRGFRNIAIEFSPLWNSGTGFSGAYTALHWLDLAVQAYACAEVKLWLVDYGLRRKPGQSVSDKSEDSMIFYGKDRRYVEVLTGDEKWSRPGLSNAFDLWGSPEDIFSTMNNVFAGRFGRFGILASESIKELEAMPPYAARDSRQRLTYL